ncbi:MAG: hypothetical protein JW963_07930 [Anaerolineales bacterium]|nr:hypothetical protein [Anaerolineales bacterium]
MVEKLFNVMFGDHEFVLRFFPFIAGITALGLFYLLLRHTTSGIGLWTGLALFATGSELIYYSSEMKQYSIDVAVATALLLLAMPLFGGWTERKNYIYLGLAGALTLWFSHPALFVLAGIGIGLFIQALKQRDRYQMNSVLLLGVTWLANLGLLYLVSLRGLSQNTFLLEYWQENFVPAPLWSDWGWLALVFSGLIRNQIGIFAPAWFVLVLAILGFIFLFRKNTTYASVLLMIFVFVLIASGLWLYPLGGRLSLFLAPLVIILISQAIDAMKNSCRLPYKLNLVFAVLVGGYLLYSPAVESLYNFINPKYFEHIRPSMATLSENWKEGDALFVSNGAAPAFRFYAGRYGLGDVRYQTSEASDYMKPENIVRRLQTLDGASRVWVLITHVYETRDYNEKDFLLSALDAMGKLKREFRSPGTSVYLFLYDLSP